MDNPCVTFPTSENWIADFNNLRCQRNYQVDSGWQYNRSGAINYKFVEYSTYNSYNIWWWNGVRVCTGSSCTVGNSTYYRGSLVLTQEGEYWFDYFYQIKKVDNLVEYKSFSSF